MHCAVILAHTWIFRMWTFFWAYHHIHKWYWVGFMRCYQIFSSLTHAYTQTAHCIPFGQPVWLYIYLSAIQQWCKMKMAVGIVVRFFYSDLDMCILRLYFPVDHIFKRKIHIFLRKPFCLAYEFFSSFYFIAYIVDIEHHTHQAELSSMFIELDFINIYSYIQCSNSKSNFYFSQTK